MAQQRELMSLSHPLVTLARNTVAVTEFSPDGHQDSALPDESEGAVEVLEWL
jgi:hypothetical protein